LVVAYEDDIAIVAEGAAVEVLDCVFRLSVEVDHGATLATAADRTARRDLGSSACAHDSFSAWISCAVGASCAYVVFGTIGFGVGGARGSAVDDGGSTVGCR